MYKTIVRLKSLSAMLQKKPLLKVVYLGLDRRPYFLCVLTVAFRVTVFASAQHIRVNADCFEYAKGLRVHFSVV